MIDNVHNRSNHKPIYIELNLVKLTYIGYRQNSENNITCNWDKATAADLKIMLNFYLIYFRTLMLTKRISIDQIIIANVRII